jgi:hypothetical protein
MQSFPECMLGHKIGTITFSDYLFFNVPLTEIELLKEKLALQIKEDNSLSDDIEFTFICNFFSDNDGGFEFEISAWTVKIPKLSLKQIEALLTVNSKGCMSKIHKGTIDKLYREKLIKITDDGDFELVKFTKEFLINKLEPLN